MKLKNLLLFTLAASLSFAAGAKSHKEYKAEGDACIKVFEKENIHFDPNNIGNYVDDNGTIRLVNGRIIIKKIKVPQYKRNVDVSVRVTVASNGDRWDKSGSCFVIPRESAINLMNIAKGEKTFPAIDPTKYEKLVGVVAGKNYLPTVELSML